MTKQIILQHPAESHSRGRSGTFTATSVDIQARPGLLSIEARSRKAGLYPPAIIGLSLEDAVLLAEEILEVVRQTTVPPDPRPQFVQCDGCNCWHPLGFTGDCRDDANRFTSAQLDEKYPDANGDGWPDWLEVDGDALQA